MTFARQFQITQDVPDLSRFADTERQRRDPCFSCELLFCDQRSKDCKFVNTSFQSRSRLDTERKALIAELISDGVILNIRGNGFIEYAGDTETDADRKRRQKRDYMRRVRQEGRYD